MGARSITEFAKELQISRQTLGFYSCSVPLFDQYVLARFISQGYFERHLNRLRRQNKGK